MPWRLLHFHHLGSPWWIELLSVAAKPASLLDSSTKYDPCTNKDCCLSPRQRHLPSYLLIGRTHHYSRPLCKETVLWGFWVEHCSAISEARQLYLGSCLLGLGWCCSRIVWIYHRWRNGSDLRSALSGWRGQHSNWRHSNSSDLMLPKLDSQPPWTVSNLHSVNRWTTWHFYFCPYAAHSVFFRASHSTWVRVQEVNIEVNCPGLFRHLDYPGRMRESLRSCNLLLSEALPQ